MLPPALLKILLLVVSSLLEKSYNTNLKKISEIALNTASKIALSLKHKIKVNYKSKSQPVTNADKEIDVYLKSYFKKHTPQIGWLSEESRDDNSRLKKELFWCLDPIDGTRSYINHKAEYTISLALIKNNIPIIGHVVNPETKEYFYAEKNFGAFCNKKKITVNNLANLNESKIAISSSEIKNLEKYNFFKSENILKLGSIAYKVALVAKGSIDVAISFTKKNDWDLAAADLILNEAGGKIKEINGNKINYNTEKTKINSVLATNSTIFEKFKKLLNN